MSKWKIEPPENSSRRRLIAADLAGEERGIKKGSFGHLSMAEQVGGTHSHKARARRGG